MGRLDLPYLWAAKGRGGALYWFYRRGGQRIPIAGPDGQRLQQGAPGFLEAYERVHRTFGQDAEPAAGEPATGTLAHLIAVYKKAPEFTKKAKRTRKDYGRYLDLIKEKHGHRRVATMPRDAVLKLRDEYAETPRTANYLMSVLRLILVYAEDRRKTFLLSESWANPARKPKRLQTGEGHRPWEESEIAAFRKKWKAGTLERVLLEAFLNTGQRGEDVAPMVRPQYFKGEIAVAQEKTRERVWIPVARDLKAVLDPWLRSHKHVVLFPTPKGRPLKVDHMRHVMRAACRAAGLPDDCTLHGLRYTFATRALEIGVDPQTMESIVGHKTAQMASKYTAKRRGARLMIVTLDAATKRPSKGRKRNTAADE